MTVTIVKQGLQSTFKSRPRTGMRHQGFPAGGAADPLSLALANRLVGNAWDTPAIESALLGPTLRFDADCAFAVTGASATLELNGIAVEHHRTLFAQAGDELIVGAAVAGARMYIAFADSPDAQPGKALETPAEFRLTMTRSWGLRVCVSAETSLLGNPDALFDTNWVVDRRADRMGLKLDGPVLEISSDGRMPSAGVFPGTIQCPEDGAPYILSVDAGTVGGYPRIAQVARLDQHVLGQLRPGDHVRLLRRDADEAISELRAKIDYWRDWLPEIEEIL